MARFSPPACLAVVLLLLALAGLGPRPAVAQIGALAAAGSGGGGTANSSDPVTFTADAVEYDRQNALVIARGRVEAWQNDNILRADEITFDRNTGVAAARGNVVLMTPDGQVMFADYAEMTRNMKDGVLRGMSAQLQENGRLVANGARRVDGQVNELAKVVYSTCDLCKENPQRAPLWQVAAASAVQDVEHKTIEYYDAKVEVYGTPIAYIPYFWHPDPSVKRQSGLLTPAAGMSSHLGGFYVQPYYWVIDGQSDMTFVPTITTRSGGDLNVEYRRRFNSGFFVFNPSVGTTDGSIQGSLATKGQFSLDETWRWGFDINRATSADYIRNFHYTEVFAGGANTLTSRVYIEGFGRGAYARLDGRLFQSLNDTVTSSTLPMVLPRAEYHYFGLPDSWGGRFSMHTNAFNIMRSDGTTTRRAALTMDWERPATGMLGDLWKIKLHNDAIGYDAYNFNQQPNFGPMNKVSTARALPQAALEFRWPFARHSGSWGSQVIEPIAEFIVAPQAGDSQRVKYPNEDSFDTEFTDTNLFGFNRFPGVDRLEGGTRANVGLHAAWYLGGVSFDGLVGQSYRTNKNYLMPDGTGLRDQVSDVVVRGTISPTPWLDFTYRTRLDKNGFATRMAEAVSSVGDKRLRVSGGYFYSTYNPYTFYDQAPPPPAGNAFYTSRNELTLGVSSEWGNYRFQGYARRNLALNQMVAYGADMIYEDECFIFDARVYRRYTSLNNDNGATTVMLLFTLKTIGDFGYRVR